MNLQTFLENFGHIVKAPGGVQRLRKLILFLAVTGKLTSRSNGSAHQFYQEIEDEKVRLINERKIKENTKVLPVREDFPFDIPSNWKWCRFGDLCYFFAGRTPTRKNNIYWDSGVYPWFSIADMRHGETIFKTSENISEVARQKVFKSEPVKAGTLLMSFKLTIGRLSITGVDAYHNEAIISIFPFAKELKEYFFKCLNGFDLTAGNKAAIKGNTLNQESISNIYVALPPKEEIIPIVTKVNELMALCDKLEAQQQDRERLFPVISDAIHARFIESPNPANLNTIFKKTEDVSPENLRKTILSLAIRGKLTNQRTSDGEAKDLLLQIDESQNSVSKKSYEISSAQRRKVEFPIPDNWIWCRIGALSELITSGSRGWAKYYSDSGAIFITMGNLSKNSYQLRLDNIRYVRPPNSSEGKRTKLQEGDILISITGEVGSLGLIPEGFGEAYINQHTCLLRLHSACRNRYFAEYLRSDHAKQQFNEPQRGIKNSFRLSDVGEMMVPVPPLEEQLRIIAKVDRLMAMVDQLEELQNKKASVAEAFAQATVAAITGTQIKEQEQMKAPKTELVTKLRVESKPRPSDKSPLANLIAKHDGELSAKALWQQSGLGIDAFYQQLKTEMSNGWISEPEKAVMKEVDAD